MDSIITVVLVVFAFMSAYKVCVASMSKFTVGALVLVSFFGMSAFCVVWYVTQLMADPAAAAGLGQ